MNELFLKIVNMSISAGWLILVVLILRLVLKKAPKWINVLLWGVVAVRLLCPFTIESPVSMIPQSIGNGELVSEWMDNAGREPVSDGAGGYCVVTKYDQLGELSTVENTIIPILMIVWISGIVLFALYTAISYWRLRCKVDTAVLYGDNIFQSENVSFPFVLGIIRPRIYLPFKMDGQNLEHVVAHEQAHICRRDHWWKPLGFFLLTIHWFNPLIWLAYVLLCRDIELACDEKVIKELDNEQRADYTQALVACSVNRRMIAACPLAFGEVGVKERVKSVMNYKKPAFWIVAVSIIACAIVAICFLTNPKQDSFDIKIVIPAGSQESFVYSDEEISPTQNHIIITSGDTLGDTEVVLKPVEVKQENIYEPTYLTSGIPVKMDVEKDAWFKIGVNIQNPADEDIVVYVKVENVEVRISDKAGTIRKWFDYTSNSSGMDLENEISTEIPEFPGVTFHYTSDQIIASKSFGGTEMDGPAILINGMPIWNAYFCDLTGDGLPEICTSLSMGSGIIDNRVTIYDYAKGVSYDLADRGHYDYYLRMNDDGSLYVDKKIYSSGELVSSGRLVFKDNCIQIEAVSSES